MPEMSVGDFKEQLREHFADSAPRVELIVGDERLVDDNQTVVEAGAWWSWCILCKFLWHFRIENQKCDISDPVFVRDVKL